MRYNYAAWQEEGQWSAYAPAVPGVFGVGSTERAAVNDLGDALDAMREYLESRGEKMPRPRKVHTGTVEA